MFQWLWLVPALPLAGFAALILAGRWYSRRAAALIGAGSVGAATIVAIRIGVSYFLAPPSNGVFQQKLWSWMNVSGFAPAILLRLDALSLVMMLAVTSVSFLILVYSSAFMSGDEGCRRFFAYMNLFVSSMLILVLAGDLLFLYLGWEGVGLCSYLLIGFWYREPANTRAAMKAFLITRVGDAAMAVGLFMLFNRLGTLRIDELLSRAPAQWAAGSAPAAAIAALLLAGALGKSAQLPLQTWLPDAMAGPTPVSALIHAATMVAAGVYLIAKMHFIFTLAPAVMTVLAVIGAVTLIYAGSAAMTQNDMKRILAYSTMSQIGYMFLALGVGAWSAAIFHFVTHAFFKSLLFLGAGVVIIRLHEERNIFRMGGLRHEMPLTFWTFLTGALALAALPPATGGMASKELILLDVWAWPGGGHALWGAAALGALLTSFYTARMVFVVFFGPVRKDAPAPAGGAMGLPMVLLALSSLLLGFLEWPHLRKLTTFLDQALPAFVGQSEEASWLSLAAHGLSLAGIVLAGILYLGSPRRLEAWSTIPLIDRLRRYAMSGWGFDAFYDALFVRPFVRLARANRDDAIDLIFTATARVSATLHFLLSRTETGKVRWYAAGLAIGALILLGMAVWR